MVSPRLDNNAATILCGILGVALLALVAVIVVYVLVVYGVITIPT